MTALPIILGCLSWLALHYFTGLVRIESIRRSSYAIEVLMEGQITSLTPIWIHALPVMNAARGKRLLDALNIGVWVFLKAALCLTLCVKAWSVIWCHLF